MRTLKAVLRLLLLLVATLTATVVCLPAQTQTYDIATFSPPSGWKVERRQNSLVFTDIDETAKTYCILGLYASRAESGSSRDDFVQEWEALVRRGFSAGAPHCRSSSADSSPWPRHRRRV